MEITKDKVTELFCIIDEFYKVFDAENAGKLLLGEDGRRKASLSDSEIMTILLYFHFGSFRNFNHDTYMPQSQALCQQSVQRYFHRRKGNNGMVSWVQATFGL